MNIRCPNCQSLFRVDPARVPPGGIRARCSRCSTAFQVTLEGTAPAAAPPQPAAPAREASAPAAAPASAATRAPEARATSRTESARATRGTPVFGTRDPHARAQRIARALVSDIVAYHPRRREEALAAGSMRTEFREEIMKSWEEYVAQVGNELAKSTPYFRNALNEILAKGQRIF